MESILKSAGEKALNLCRQKAVEAEAFLVYNKELDIDVTDGKVENLKEAAEIGIGLRVFKQGKMGFAYSSDLSETAIENVVKDAINISSYTSFDEFNCLPDGGQLYKEMQTYDDNIVSCSLEKKIAMACEVEKIARAYDKRITVVERAGYEDNQFHSLIMNSRGLYAYGKGSFCGLYIFLIAEEDEDAQNGFSVMIKKKIADLDPRFVGEEAAHDAVRSLKARTIPSGRMSCIMEPYVVSNFMKILANSVEADSVQKAKAMFNEESIGQQIASPVLNIIDDSTSEEGIASFPFDGEGIATGKNIVIENGILKGFLYDSYSGLKAGKKSTGNAQRASFRGLPSVGVSNFILVPGQESPDQLISAVDKGFYITDVMGMHTANPISGDFSVGASGLMIENGKLSYPVRGATIAGNMKEFLKNIEAVGSDQRFYGGKAASTIRIKAMSIGGR